MFALLGVQVAGFFSDINIITRGQIVEKFVWPFLMFLDLRFIQTLVPGICFFFVWWGWGAVGGEKNVGAWGCLYEEISCEVSVGTVSTLCQLVAG